MRLCATLFAAWLAGCATARAPGPHSIPFDPHANQVTLAAASRGRPLALLLDTAVDPSAIDRPLAAALGLQRRGADGAVEGVGSDSATAYDSVLSELTIGGRSYGPIEVAVFDMSKLRTRFGRPLDGILGYTFLKDRAVVIDYASERVTLHPAGAEAADALRTCRKTHAFPLRFISEDDRIILVPGLKIAGVEVRAMLDTGSSNGLRIEDAAEEIAPLRHLLPAGQAGTSVGARGEASLRRGRLGAPATLGPFTVHDADVALVARRGGALPPVNIGNRFLRAMGARLLVDIPGRRVGFYADCG